MTRKCVVLSILTFVFFSIVGSACSLNITLTSDVQSIMQSKRIWLRVQLESNEHGIVKDSLRFSIDSPCVIFKQWRATRTPVVVYDSLFRKNKKLLTGSCDCWLHLDFAFNDHVLCSRSLEQSCVYVACLVFTRDKGTVPVNMCVPLCAQANELACCDQEETNACCEQLESVIFTNQRQDVVDGEFKILDTLEQHWCEVRSSWDSALQSTAFKRYYALLLVLLFVYFGAVLWYASLSNMVVVDFFLFDCGKMLLFVWLLCSTAFFYSVMPAWSVRLFQLFVVLGAACYFSIAALYATFLKRRWYGLLGSILFSLGLPLSVRVAVALLG